MRQRAFSLLELLVVIAVIGALAAIGIPLYLHGTERAAIGRCHLAVQAVATAAADYGLHSWEWIETGKRRGATMWDLNRDGLLDGDPAHDPAFGASSDPSAASASASGYRGFLAMTGCEIPSALRRDGTVVDHWGRPLRIRMVPVAGTATWRVWSAGADGVDATADDLRSDP